MVSPGGVLRIPQDTYHLLLRNWNEECEGATRCSQWNKAAIYWEEIMNLAILPLAITMLAGPQHVRHHMRHQREARANLRGVHAPVPLNAP